MHLEHPTTTQINKSGYPNLAEQSEHMGTDFFGTELLVGDEVVEFDGEIVLRENLHDFLVELGFSFKTL